MAEFIERAICVIKQFIICLLIGSCFSGMAQTKKEKINIVKSHAIQLSPIPDFSFIDAFVQNKQFVFLSDGHQSAISKQYFTTLIKYLHEQQGFHVLVLESSFFSADYAWEKINIEPTRAKEILEENTIGFFGKCDAMQELFDYTGSEVNTTHPLYLAGMDDNFTTDPAIFLNIVDSILNNSNSGILQDEMYAKFRVYFEEFLVHKNKATLDSMQRQYLWSWADTIMNLLEQTDTGDGYNKLLGMNIHAYLKSGLYQAPIDNANIRNKQMYCNLSWLMQEVYPGQKMVIWASPAHLSEGFAEKEKPMVTFLYELANRTDIFYLAATSFRVDGNQVADRYTLPWYLHQTNSGDVFMSLHYPVDPFISNFTDAIYFDALLFIEEERTCEWKR